MSKYAVVTILAVSVVILAGALIAQARKEVPAVRFQLTSPAFSRGKLFQSGTPATDPTFHRFSDGPARRPAPDLSPSSATTRTRPAGSGSIG